MFLEPLAYNSSYINYELTFTYFVKRDGYQNQAYCDNNTIFNNATIGFQFNTSDFAVTCGPGCASSQNTALLGYMTGYCDEYSVNEDWSMIVSTYSVVGSLAPQFGDFFIIQSGAVNYLFNDWIPLSHYYNSTRGYNFKMYNSMAVRPDTGLLNTPPQVITDPILTMPTGYIYLFNLPVYDSNEDTIMCKYLFLNLR